MGMVLALSRAFIIETGVAFDPEAALMGVVAHTHYLPQHGRGRWAEACSWHARNNPVGPGWGWVPNWGD